jgi:biotin carboxyl carrier protein
MTNKRIITVDGEKFEVDLERQGDEWHVVIEEKIFRINIDGGHSNVGQKRQRGGKKRKMSGTISSSIPGKIISLYATIGDMVEEGDVIMILEAMKMQNEIQAPLSGEIIEINCQSGDSVEANMPLLVIEPIENSDN